MATMVTRESPATGPRQRTSASVHLASRGRSQLSRPSSPHVAKRIAAAHAAGSAMGSRGFVARSPAPAASKTQMSAAAPAAPPDRRRAGGRGRSSRGAGQASGSVNRMSSRSSVTTRGSPPPAAPRRMRSRTMLPFGPRVFGSTRSSARPLESSNAPWPCAIASMRSPGRSRPSRAAGPPGMIDAILGKPSSTPSIAPMPVTNGCPAPARRSSRLGQPTRHGATTTPSSADASGCPMSEINARR